MFVRRIAIRGWGLACLMLCAGAALPAMAGPLTAEQSRQLDAFMKQRGTVHAPAPGRRGEVPATADAAAGGDIATVARPEAGRTPALPDLDAPPSVPAGLTFGITTGQGIQPALPEMAAWEKDAARAIVAAFEAPEGKTAEQRATFAATPSADPVFEERVQLVRTLYGVDGTEPLIRSFVAKEHMKLIIQEVARHIDIGKLSETDRYRLAAIAAVVQTELEDRILDLYARQQAANLTKPELMQLIVAFNIDAQRKLTRLRLDDDGKIDRAAELDLRLAQYQIVKQYEAGQ